MKRIVAVAALALALPAPTAGGVPSGGLHGRVVVSPARPVCRVGQSCTAPATHVWLVFSRRGRTAGKTRTDRLGRYRIALPPGTYAVRSPSGRLGKGLRPRQVVVPRGRFLRENFTLDVGIR